MDQKIRQMLAESQERLCYLEAQMSLNKGLMLLMTLLTVATVLMNKE